MTEFFSNLMSNAQSNQHQTLNEDDAGAEGTYIIVDKEGKSHPQHGSDPIPLHHESDKEVYWQYVTAGKTPPDSRPTLIIMYGPLGSGKSWVLEQFKKEHNLDNYVQLDPDVLRVCSKEFRLCLSGAHAAQLHSVQRTYGGRLKPTKHVFTLGEETWEEDGYTVDGKFLALAESAIRSQPIVRQAMLWQFQREDEMTDAFTDRAFRKGYNVIYDTMGNEPNRFLHELIKRARRNNHDYKVIVLGC